MSWKTEASEEVIGRRPAAVSHDFWSTVGADNRWKPEFLYQKKELAGKFTVRLIHPRLGAQCRQWWTWPECKQGFGYIPAG